MRIAKMIAWKWYRRGLLKGSVKDDGGIHVPENLVPKGTESAKELVSVTEYARRERIHYYMAVEMTRRGEIPNSFRDPSGRVRVMVFKEDES